MGRLVPVRELRIDEFLKFVVNLHTILEEHHLTVELWMHWVFDNENVADELELALPGPGDILRAVLVSTFAVPQTGVVLADGTVALCAVSLLDRGRAILDEP